MRDQPAVTSQRLTPTLFRARTLLSLSLALSFSILLSLDALSLPPHSNSYPTHTLVRACYRLHFPLSQCWHNLCISSELLMFLLRWSQVEYSFYIALYYVKYYFSLYYSILSSVELFINIYFYMMLHMFHTRNYEINVLYISHQISWSENIMQMPSSKQFVLRINKIVSKTISAVILLIKFNNMLNLVISPGRYTAVMVIKRTCELIYFIVSPERINFIIHTTLDCNFKIFLIQTQPTQ